MRRLFKILFFLALWQTGLIIPYWIWQKLEKRAKDKKNG